MSGIQQTVNRIRALVSTVNSSWPLVESRHNSWDLASCWEPLKDYKKWFSCQRAGVRHLHQSFNSQTEGAEEFQKRLRTNRRAAGIAIIHLLQACDSRVNIFSPFTFLRPGRCENSFERKWRSWESRNARSHVHSFSLWISPSRELNFIKTTLKSSLSQEKAFKEL